MRSQQFTFTLENLEEEQEEEKWKSERGGGGGDVGVRENNFFSCIYYP
jgi:hypothetical protein